MFKRLENHPANWALICIILVLSPQAMVFPGWISALIILFLLWRFFINLNPNHQPSKWLLILILFSTTFLVFIDYGTIIGKTAGTAFIGILLSIKLLESKVKKDYMVVIALCFFFLVLNFLISQSILTAIYLFLTVIVLIATMILINQETAPFQTKARFKYATKLTLQALPLMLIIFILFPRIPGPLWALPNDAKSGTTGLSDSMTPGNIAELIQSSALAFRVKFENNIPSRNDLYWRVMVFWQFDGRTWRKGPKNQNRNMTISNQAKVVDYTITLEPSKSKWLPALDIPFGGKNKVIFTNDFTLETKDDIDSLFRYNSKSFLKYTVNKDISSWESFAGLSVPHQKNPKTIALGKKWATEFSNPVDIVNKALDKFNKQEYHYTLHPPLTLSDHPVDEFLFETKSGFCEHYASAFTLLMRSAGIPSRVVVGYQGGTINPFTGDYSIKQSDAHAWAEVWIDGRGWIRTDPTAAIAPERIEKNVNAALAENESRPLHMRLDFGVIKQLKLYWDAVDNKWKQMVLGYNFKRQKDFLSDLFKRDIQFQDLGLMLIFAFFVTTFLIALLIFKPFSFHKIDPMQKLYNRFCKKMHKLNIIRVQSEGPQDFAKRIIKTKPELKDKVESITNLYIDYEYRSVISDDKLISMKNLVSQL